MQGNIEAMKILWIPHTGWHIHQRAHHFCRPLSERHEIHVTDWVADFTSFGDYLTKRYITNFVYRRYQDGNIQVHGIPRISPALHFPRLRRFNERIYSRYVDRIIDRYDIEVVVGTFVVPPPKAARVVFDLFDENVTGWVGRAPRYAQEIESNEREYLLRADVIVAASSVLVDKAKDLGAGCPIVHVPNGIEVSRFQLEQNTRFREQQGIRGKIVGTIGNHDNPAEVQKILDIAGIYPDKSVTFVIAGRGGAIPGAIRSARRRGLQNLLFTGEFKPEETPEIVAAFDVGLCPYDVTPMDDARTPLRLLAYAAAGVPAVCSNLKEVRRMKLANTLVVEDTVADFIDGIQQAFMSPRGAPEQIRSYDLNALVLKYESILLGERDSDT